MSNQENTNEKTDIETKDVEMKELAEAVENALTEESVVDSKNDEVQEYKAEEPERKMEKVPFRLSKKILAIAGGILAFLIIIYFSVAMYYSNRFLIGTTVNGVNCAGKTLEEVETYMQAQVEQYVLTINGADGYSQQIQGVDIDIKYDGVDVIQEAFEEQNEYGWIGALFAKNHITANVSFTYDSEKLDQMIAGLDCLKEENQKEAVSAKPVYQDGTYVIQAEVPGTQVDQEKLKEAIQKSVDEMQPSMELTEKGCYIQPRFTTTSEEVISAKDGLNKCLEAKVTYSLDGITVTVDKTQIADWISVDDDMNVQVSEKKARQFTDTLGKKYNTPDKAQEIVTPTGKKAKVSGAILGRKVGSAADCEQLISEIKEGKVVTRQPVLSQKATPEGEYAWGTTYTEVDLSVQHMWHISKGKVVFETDIVTGSPGRDTPAGVFKILEKKRNKTLVGNIVPETGQPEYRTPVSYWARITWSGVGFHDATWQPEFGGDLYLTRGSHGCINMPLSDVATYYNMISVGTPVIIHY